MPKRIVVKDSRSGDHGVVELYDDAVVIRMENEPVMVIDNSLFRLTMEKFIEHHGRVNRYTALPLTPAAGAGGPELEPEVDA